MFFSLASSVSKEMLFGMAPHIVMSATTLNLHPRTVFHLCVFIFAAIDTKFFEKPRLLVTSCEGKLGFIFLLPINFGEMRKYFIAII